jgi:hypothetical protein
MIAFKDNLPLVQFEGGQVVAFQRDWLLRSLAEAACKAGYQKWWLAEHVAESVTAYLMHNDENVVTVPRLAKSVQSILQVIGYGEIASHFVPGPPLVRISLLDLACTAGTGYELAFFDVLAHSIRDVMEMEANYFELLDLERCVKHLRSRKIWSRDCDALRAEIVAFVREQIFAVKPGREIAFALA